MAGNENKNPAPADDLLAKIVSAPAAAVAAPASSNGVAADSGKTPSADAAAFASSKLFAARNERAEKRGRHPKGCTCGNCSQSRVAGVVKTGKPSVPAAEINLALDAEMAREAVKAATHLMDSFSVLLIGIAAKKKGAENDVLTELTDKAKMSNETRRGISESGALVLKKYNCARLAPEIACGLYVSAWLSSVIITLAAIYRLPELPIENPAPPK